MSRTDRWIDLDITLAFLRALQTIAMELSRGFWAIGSWTRHLASYRDVQSLGWCNQYRNNTCKHVAQWAYHGPTEEYMEVRHSHGLSSIIEHSAAERSGTISLRQSSPNLTKPFAMGLGFRWQWRKSYFGTSRWWFLVQPSRHNHLAIVCRRRSAVGASQGISDVPPLGTPDFSASSG